MARKKILVMAYAVSPYRGSEYSVAWNYVTNMSRDNDLTILYGISDEHMGDNQSMEKWLSENSLPHARFVFVRPNRWANALNWLNRHDTLVYTFYFAYAVWHKCAYRMAKQLMKEEHFDLVHMVGMIGYREPGYLWKLGLPYIWGPVSGVNNSPAALMKHLPLSGKMRHGFRTVANSIQLRCSHRLKKALLSTDILLTATSENLRVFKRLYGKDSICLPENAITGDIHLAESKFPVTSPIRLLFVGRIDAGKNVNMILEAIELMKHKEDIHLDIVGDGPLRNSLQQYAHEHDMDSLITWHGQMPREQVMKTYQSAHLHIITSISEGNPTTIWEAMSYGVPTLSFDHCGMHDTLKDGAGILLPIAPTYQQNVENLTKALDGFVSNPKAAKEYATKTIERAKQYTWEERTKFLNALYDSLLKEKAN